MRTHKDSQSLAVSGRIHRGSLLDGMLSATKDKCHDHPHFRSPLLEVVCEWGLDPGGFLLDQALGIWVLALTKKCLTHYDSWSTSGMPSLVFVRVHG